MTKKRITVICCPSAENITEHDKREIYNLLVFKEKYHEAQKIKNIFRPREVTEDD